MELLATKFHIPGIEPSTQVIREELLDRMTRALSRRLIWVAAPAGYGKSTFLSQWIGVQGLDDSVCWLSLESGDNDPVRFWTYVLEGFNRLGDNLCARALIQLGAVDEAMGVENVLITLINDLDAAKGQWVLVLDDCHLIRNPAIYDNLHFLLDHAPESLTLVIASRRNHFPGVARLKVAGQVLEIGQEDLRFSGSEVDAYIRLWTRHPPPSRDKDRILAQTEGWAAALKLFMLSWDRAPETIGCTGDKGHRIVETYLLEEVFSKLSKPVRNTACAISILDRFCPSLIRAVTGGGPRFEDPLGSAMRHHLFLIPLDRDGIWFRFHHLFRDFLRKQLTGALEESSLHHRAAVWFDENDCFEEAFDHALKAGRPDLAAGFLAGKTPRLYDESGEQRLNRFFSRLCIEDIQREAVLAAYYYSLKVYCLEFEAMTVFYSILERRHWSDSERKLLKGFSLSQKAYLAFYRHGDFERVLDYYHRAMPLVPGGHTAMRRMMDFLATMCLRFQGRIEKALVLSTPKPHDNRIVSALMAMNRTDLEMELGHLSWAMERLEQEVASVEACFGRNIPGLCGYLFINYGIALKERQELEKAARAFEQGIRAARRMGFIELVIISFGEYSLFLTAIKAFDKAHAALDHAVRLINESGSGFMADYFTPFKSWIWLKEGRFDLVAPMAESIPATATIPYLESLRYLVAVRYFIRNRDWDRARGILSVMIREDQTLHRNRRLMESYTLMAKLHFQKQDEKRALEWLSLALELARSQGYAHLFLSEFEDDLSLLLAAKKKGCLPGYLEDFLARGREDTSRQVMVHDFPEAFSTRELDILKHFKAGASNKETAEALCLSVNTVRWYASNIFAKLSVKRRGQAVVRAEELGLI